jgi:hypothetical protein
MNINNKDTILAGTSPSIKRCHYFGSTRDTDSKNKGSVPRIILHDTVNATYVQSSDNKLWYRNGDSYVTIKKCSVSLENIFSDSSTDLMCSISSCSAKNCKTCYVLITGNVSTSNQTGRYFCTKTLENLTCRSSNVVYSIECNLCGLVYVGETKGLLNKRISAHRFQINNGGNHLLYKHFNSLDHSILSMRARILEKKQPNIEYPFP